MPKYVKRAKKRGKKSTRKTNYTRKVYTRKLSRYARPEVKVIDLYGGQQQPTNASLITLITPAIVQGTTNTTRIGNKIKSWSLLVRGQIQADITTANTLVRVHLIWDREPNATAITQGLIYTATGTPLSPVNEINMDRFRTLRDLTFSFSNTGTTAKSFKIFKKLKGATRYNDGNTATITDVQRGCLFIILTSDQTVTLPTVTFYTQYKFTD